MLETELKSIITKEIYDKIKNTFKWDSSAEQTNYYYTDTEGYLRKKRIMVRVREKNGASKLQIKLHKNSGSSLQICEENEYDVNGVPEYIPAETAMEITGINTGSLICMGNSKTLRNSLMWDRTTEICLDKTTYFDITDYEIELEYTDTLDKELLEKLSSLGVEFKSASVGKFSRFLKKYDERKNM
ncbi:MAG: CYTH domain-containing protein [Clostridia bacterium]